MKRNRTHSSEFKRQVCEEYLSHRAGMAQLSRRYALSTSLIRTWIGKYEQGEYSGLAASSPREKRLDARVAELERKIGQLTMENEFLKRADVFIRQRRSEASSVTSGPLPSPSGKDAT